MESNGSWLVATHQAAGIDFGIAPLPKGTAGQATSINPTGAVVYKGTKNPEAAWAFVKYLASPEAQTKIMELRGLAAGQQGGPDRAVRDVLRRRPGPRRRDRLRPSQAVVPGLQRLDHRAPDGARRQRLQRAEQDGQAGRDRRAPAARRDPRQAVTSRRIGRAHAMIRTSASRGPQGSRAAGGRGPLGAGVPRADPDRPGRSCRPGRSWPPSRSA